MSRVNRKRKRMLELHRDKILQVVLLFGPPPRSSGIFGGVAWTHDDVVKFMAVVEVIDWGKFPPPTTNTYASMYEATTKAVRRTHVRPS